MTNLVGTTLGQYQIVELIGEGGMAAVYKAWQPSLRRYVALKVLAPHLSGDAEFVQRFHQEAVSAANLKQSNIVTIHDVGTESGYHYIAMELVEGASLEDRIRSGQSFNSEQVVDIVSQIGAALDYAHQRGFIHRDIKPANILIEPAGRVVLTDFGIVKALSGSGVTSALTRAGTVFGTPEYMSPEQIRDEPLDHRSDLYALGIVCYEMLAGKVPFAGGTTHAILYAQVNNPPPALRDTARLSVSPPVEAVVNKMLAKERGERYNSAGEFARDLAQAVSGVWPAGLGGGTVVAGQGGGPERTAVMGGTPPGMRERTVRMDETPAGEPAPTVAGQSGPSWTPQPQPAAAQPAVPARRRRRWPLVLGIAAAAIVAVLILGTLIGVLVLGVENPLKSVQAMWDLRRARAALDDGDYAEAADKFSLVLENAPDNEEAIDGQLEAAEELVQDGQFDAAIEAYQAVQEAQPGEVRALRGLGQAYGAKGDWAEAATWYEKWTQAAPEDGEAYLALGNARFELEDVEGTVAAYERAEDLGADSPEKDLHLGLGYYALARYEEAIGPLQNVAGQNPEDFALQRALGVSLYAVGRPDQALEHLNKAVELGADRPSEELVDVYYALGGSTFAQQDYERSISFYQRAQELDPEGQAVWAGEAQANLEQAYPELAGRVMGEAVLDLDFSNVVTEGEETYAVAKTGQRARIEGAVHLVDGPWEGSQALVVEEGTTNECKNPSFATNAKRWGSSSQGTIARTDEEHKFDAYSLLCESGGGQDFAQGAYTGGVSSFDATEAYALSVWYKLDDLPAGHRVLFGVYWKGGAHADAFKSVLVGNSQSGGWHKVSAVMKPDYNDRTDVVFYFRIYGATANGQGFYLDGFQVEQARNYTTSTCIGSLAHCAWSGMAHTSPSIRVASQAVLSQHVVQTGAGAYAVWFKGSSGVWNNGRMFYLLLDGSGHSASVANAGSIVLWRDIGNSLRFTVLDDIGERQEVAWNASTLNDGWHFIVATWSSTPEGAATFSLYVDGDLKAKDDKALASSPDTNDRFVIGATDDGVWQCNGSIAGVIAFSHHLTAAEVEALYNLGAPASR